MILISNRSSIRVNNINPTIDQFRININLYSPHPRQSAFHPKGLSMKSILTSETMLCLCFYIILSIKRHIKYSVESVCVIT